MREELKVKVNINREGEETFTIDLEFYQDTVITAGDRIRIVHDFRIPKVEAYLERKEIDG